MHGVSLQQHLLTLPNTALIGEDGGGGVCGTSSSSLSLDVWVWCFSIFGRGNRHTAVLVRTGCFPAEVVHARFCMIVCAQPSPIKRGISEDIVFRVVSRGHLYISVYPGIRDDVRWIVILSLMYFFTCRAPPDFEHMIHPV